MNLPDTILYPDKFNKSKPPGFDGIFDWSWLKDCFGETKIMPMDFDAVVERYRNYLVIETKDENKPIPQGQLITLNNLIRARSFTVMKVWGKTKPGRIEILLPSGKEKIFNGYDEARDFVKNWFEWTNH